MRRIVSILFLGIFAFTFISCQGKISVHFPQFKSLSLNAISDQFDLLAGTPISLDAGVVADDASNLASISYSCYYDQVVDQNVSITHSCSEIAGLIFNESTGQFNWTPSPAQTGNYEFLIIANSGDKSGSVIFSLEIINATPLLDAIADQAVSEGDSIATIDANDGGDDLDSDGDTITYSCSYDQALDGMVSPLNSCTSISGVSFNSSTGVLDWATVNNQTGTYEFKISGTDGMSSGNRIFSITVSDTNFAPVLSAGDEYSYNENEAITPLDANDGGDDFDDDGDAITYSCYYDNTANGVVASTTPCTDLGATFNSSTGVFNWTPNYNQAGTYEIKITGTDGSLSDDVFFLLNVFDVNRAPVLDAIADQAGAVEGTPITTVNAADSADDFDADGDAITYSCYYDTSVNGTVASTTLCTALGATFNTATGVMDWTPNASQSGIYEFRITGTDGSLSDDELFVITVANSNAPPVLDAIANQIIAENEAITTIDAADGGDDFDFDGDTITYSCYYDTTVDGVVATTNLCSTLGVSFNSSTGVMNWTTNYFSENTYEFKIVATDGSLEGYKIFTIEVTHVPAFISKWRTTLANTSITLPLRSGFNYNFEVDWGDGSAKSVITSWDDADKTHTYAAAGTYTMTILGSLEAWYFNYNTSADYIIEVLDFGDMGWINLNSAFYGCEKLTSFAGGGTENVTDMSYMFSWDYSLTSLDLSSFNTSQVTDMSNMLERIDMATSIDLSNFDTSNVTNMSSMFSGSAFTEIILSSFDTSNVTNMSYMLSALWMLPNINLSNFNTVNVTSMMGMFEGTEILSSLDLSNFNTLNVTDMSRMFYSSKALTAITFSSNFNTTNVTNMSDMFNSAFMNSPTPVVLDLSSFDTNSATNMSRMFAYASKVSSIIFPVTFTTASVTNMSSMFLGMTGLTALDVSTFNTSSVTNMNGMFSWWTTGPNILDLSTFNTSNVTDMRSMFQNSSSLTELYLNGWDIVPAPLYTNIFTGVTNISTALHCDPPGTGTMFGVTCN